MMMSLVECAIRDLPRSLLMLPRDPSPNTPLTKTILDFLRT